MGFDPRRWRPSSGSRPLTGNVEALLAENEALRRQVRSLQLQLQALLEGDAVASPPWEPMRERQQAAGAAGRGAEADAPWTASARRSRSARGAWTAADPPRSRVTVGSSHGLSPDLVERWTRSLARHRHWQDLRIGPPGGLRAVEQELRRHWWNPALSLEQELDRRCPGLGSELAEALRGPHSRGRWAVRVAFALYGPRAPEWLSEEPQRVVDELLRRVQQLERQADSEPGWRGTRTANHSSEPGAQAGWADGQAGGGPGPQGRPPGDGASRQAGQGHGGAGRADSSSQQAGPQNPGRGSRQRSASGGQGPGRRASAAGDPRSQALELLGLEPGATAAAIKRAYRRLAKAHHPDLGGDAAAFLRIDAAYRTLL